MNTEIGKQDVLNILRMNYRNVKHIFNTLYIGDLVSDDTCRKTMLIDLESSNEMPLYRWDEKYITHELKIIEFVFNKIQNGDYQRITMLVNTTTNKTWNIDPISNYMNAKIVYIAENADYMYIITKANFHVEDTVVINEINKHTTLNLRYSCKLGFVYTNRLLCKSGYVNIDNIIYNNLKNKIDKEYILREAAKLDLCSIDYVQILNTLYDYSSHLVDEWFKITEEFKDYLLNIKTLQKVRVVWVNTVYPSSDTALITFMNENREIKGIFTDSDEHCIGGTWVTCHFERTGMQFFEALIETDDTIIWIIRNYGRYNISVMNKETHETIEYKNIPRYKIDNKDNKMRFDADEYHSKEFNIKEIWGTFAH